MGVSRSLRHVRLVWFVSAFALLLVATVGSGVGSGQQKIQMQGGIPVAPRGLWGLKGKPLPTTPMVFDTAEGQRIRVVIVTKALAFPWSAAFLPNGDMLVTEREGRLRRISKDVLDPKPIAGGPIARNLGVSGEPGAIHGYMDIALHPKFAENGFVYLSYTKPIDDKRQTTAIARGRWDGHALTGTKDILVADIGTARIAFGKDEKLYVTTVAVGGNAAQELNSLGGKVLRLNDDGSVPKDNPFAGKAGARPEVYTLGHRSSLGLAVHPGTGEMWLNENGPNGGDEINVLKPGLNYGWPLVSYGRQYTGPWQNDRAGHAGFEPPIVCTGCRRSPCRAWRFTPAIGSRSGRATSLSAASVRVRFPARAMSSESCSTRRWKRCGVSRCSSNCASGSATSGRGPMGCCTC
jgi:glucose/arabinose dehydrogenase